MKSYFPLLLLLLAFSTCKNASEKAFERSKTSIAKMESAFENEKPQSFLQRGADISTTEKKYDFYEAQYTILSALETEGNLDKTDQVELTAILNGVEEKLEKTEQQLNLQKSPVFYEAFTFFEKNFKVDQLIDTTQVKVLTTELETLPSFYENAKTNIHKAKLKDIKTSIDKNIQLFGFLRSDLRKNIDQLDLAENQQKHLNRLINNGIIAVKDYIAFCKSLQFELLDH